MGFVTKLVRKMTLLIIMLNVVTTVIRAVGHCDKRQTRMFVAYDVCGLMTFVAYDVCRLMTFVASDICRIMRFVGFDACRLIRFVGYDVCRIMTFVANYDVCRLLGLSQYRLW